MHVAYDVIETDVLIIGGGVSGARAAVEARARTPRVVMVMKAGFGKGGASCINNWGRVMSVPNGHTDPDDTPEEHYNDIIRAGAGVCDENLARILAYEVIDRFDDLEKWGLSSIVKTHGKCQQILPAFCSHSRGVCTYGLGIAPSIVNLLRTMIEDQNITVFEDVMILSLLMNDGECVGALGIDRQARFTVFTAKSTILATGGGGAVFPHSGYPDDATGDGYSLGFRAGAELANMEFVQMALHGVQIGFMCLVPSMYNGLGEEFLSRYLPEGVTAESCFMERSVHTPFTTRDQGKYIDIAVYKETLAGRGNIYADFTEISRNNIENTIASTRIKGYSEIEYLLDSMKHSKSGSANPVGSAVEITCCGHAFNGGFRINERTETTLPGCYAVGEAATGPHGADRLGGNMIAVSQVFGARAGKYAALRANSLNKITINDEQVTGECKRASNALQNSGDISPKDVKVKINDIMWRNCLVVRNQTGLEHCVGELKRIRNETLPRLSADREEDIFMILEIPKMLDVCEMVAYAALERKESRGSHYREDYPGLDDGWTKTINVSTKNLVLQ